MRASHALGQADEGQADEGQADEGQADEACCSVLTAQRGLGWHQGVQMDGKPYYYSDSGGRQWDRPQAMGTAATAGDIGWQALR